MTFWLCDISIFETFAGSALAGKNKEHKVAPWDDIPDESDVESDEADWVMAEPANPVASLQQQAKAQGNKSMVLKNGEGKKKKKKPRGGLDAFASADDYLQQIETDLANAPADVVVPIGDDNTPKSVPARSLRRNVGIKRPARQKA